MRRDREDRFTSLQWNTFHPSSPVYGAKFKGRVDLTDSWRKRRADDAHTLLHHGDSFPSPRVTFESRWPRLGIVKEKTNRDFFPTAFVARHRPTQIECIHTPWRKSTLIYLSPRQGIEYISWHDYRYSPHCNPNFQKNRTTFRRWERKRGRERKSVTGISADGRNRRWRWERDSWKPCVKPDEIRPSLSRFQTPSPLLSEGGRDILST